MPDEGRQILLTPLTRPGQTLTFNYRNRQLASGWSKPENWGTWTEGRQAKIQLRVQPPARSIVIDALAFISPGHPGQRLIVSLNGQQVLDTRLMQFQGNRLEIPISAALSQRLGNDDRLDIELHLPDAVSPRQLGINDDSRIMGLGLKTLTVQ